MTTYVIYKNDIARKQH